MWIRVNGRPTHTKGMCDSGDPMLSLCVTPVYRYTYTHIHISYMSINTATPTSVYLVIIFGYHHVYICSRCPVSRSPPSTVMGYPPDSGSNPRGRCHCCCRGCCCCIPGLLLLAAAGWDSGCLGCCCWLVWLLMLPLAAQCKQMKPNSFLWKIKKLINF